MAPPPDAAIPEQPIDRVLRPFHRFLHVATAAGAVLLLTSGFALLMANSPWAEGYAALWKTPIQFSVGDFVMRHSLNHWINDGLMAVFFFVVGLEVKRELSIGELREMRAAALPAFAALGGMVVPAGIYALLQSEGPGASGWGIPMATDIAFVVGCMAILGQRLPPSLRILLLSLAIVDDIGAILVIAFAYTSSIDFGALAVGLVAIATIEMLARLGVRGFGVYGVLGLIVWLGFHESGVHATIAGVILGLMTPATPYLENTAVGHVFRRVGERLRGDDGQFDPPRAAQVRQIQWAARETLSPLEYLEDLLHPWAGFVIVPIFALANAAVPIDVSALVDPVAVSVAIGLVVGKPLGITLFAWLAVRLGVATLPEGVSWGILVGGGFLAGIGFTMALFISGLALQTPELEAAKTGVLVGSIVAAVIGMALLLKLLPPAKA